MEDKVANQIKLVVLGGLCVFWFAFLLQWLFAIGQLFTVVQYFPEQLISYVIEGTANFYRLIFDFTPLFILLTSGLLAAAVVGSNRQKRRTFMHLTLLTIGVYGIAVLFEQVLLMVAREPNGSAILTFAVRYSVFLVLSTVAISQIWQSKVKYRGK